MIFPRFLRLTLVIVMLLIGSGVAEGAHLALEHHGGEHHPHDVDHCELCQFLIHGQAQPTAPTFNIAFIATVEPAIIVVPACGHTIDAHNSRHSRAPPAHR